MKIHFISRSKLNLSKNRGYTSVEMIVGFLLLITTLLAVVQIIAYIYSYVILAQAAKEGVRYAIVHGSTNSLTSSVSTEVSKYAHYSFLNVCYIKDTDSTSCCTVDSSSNTCTGNNDPPSRVRVQLTAPFSMFSLGWATPNVHAAAEGRVFY
jgi:Flp pilus assembly protein TadG